MTHAARELIHALPADPDATLARVRRHDWTATPLGPPDRWSPVLRTLVDLAAASALPVAVLWGPDLIQIYNPAYAALLGDRDAAAFGHSARDTGLQPLDRAADAYDRALAGETVSLARGIWTTVCSLQLAPVREAGEVAGVHVMAFRTGRRRVTRRRWPERRRAASALVGLHAFRWNIKSGRVHWDPDVTALWREPPSVTLTLSEVQAAIHPDDRPRMRAALQQALDPAGDGAFYGEYRTPGRDNTERWVFSHGQTLFEGGQPVEMIGAVLDITEAKRAEAELRKSEARLAAILAQLPVGVGLFDSAGYLVMGNALIRQFCEGALPFMNDAQWRGYDADGRVLAPSEYPGERALRGETVVPGMDLLRIFDDGREVWTRMSTAPFDDGSGRPAGVVKVVQDIDQEKRAEQLKSLLISELQHRTRNLLGVVAALARRTLKSAGSLQEFRERFLPRLEALSRVQRVLSAGEGHTADVGELVRAELAALGADADGERVRVEGPPASLGSKAVQVLALAVHELGTNAVKYGALSQPQARLAVTWGIAGAGDAPRLVLDWRETEVRVRPQDIEAPRGYGRDLVELSLPYDLGAQTTFEILPGGVRCRIEVPMAAPANRYHGP